MLFILNTQLKIKLKKILKFLIPWLLIKEKNRLLSEYEYYLKDLSKRNLKFLLASNILYKKKNKSELKKLRNQIIKNYLLHENQIRISNLNQFLKLKVFDKIRHKINTKYKFNLYKCAYYKISHYGILNHFQKKKNKLLVYIEGHGNKSPHDQKHFSKIEKIAQQKGYDVLSLCMSGHGFNYCEPEDFDFPGKKKNAIPLNHGSFEAYKDKKKPAKKPLSLMLSGNYYLIKYIIKKFKYTKTTLLGFSGGGWYVTLLGAIDDKIKNTISVAGTIPLIFKGNSRYLGDWEQHESDIYNISDYIDWYELCTLDKNLKSTRKHVQIYNSHDPKTSDGVAASKLKKMFQLKNFKVIISKNNKHSVKSNDIKKFL